MIAAKGASASGAGGLARQSSPSDAARSMPRHDAPASSEHPSRGAALVANEAASAVPAQVHPLERSALPKNLFLKELLREKRRSDRSLSPLSIVVYQIDDKIAAKPRDIARLLELLDGAKRETDILGHAGNDLIAVLCPYTDEQGIKGFTRKIDSQMSELPFAAICATYPDQVFDSIASGAPTRPELATILDAPVAYSQSDGYALKRSLDLAGAIVALVLCAPLMLIAALMVATTSRGPIIFKQQRLGKGGKPFTFYKFRSMVTNADDSVHREFVANLIKAKETDARPGESGSAPYKLENDPRVTRVGRFLRKTSIDELPQLFSVLKGDMTLVGPRPPIPYETSLYQPWHLRRLVTVKPGITGLWQVAGRSSVSFNEMVRMDLRYIRDCSLTLDLKILFKTLAVVVGGKGAV